MLERAALEDVVVAGKEAVGYVVGGPARRAALSSAIVPWDGLNVLTEAR